MGQYLAIGIVTRSSASKKEMLKAQVSTERLVGEMSRLNGFEPGLYDFSETDAGIFFQLKKEVLEPGLVPFLEALYPLLYPGEPEMYEPVLKRLRETAPEQWLDFADRKSEEAFQFDEYGHGDYLRLERSFGQSIRVEHQGVMLSMEGKIMMETYGRQFSFFQRCAVSALAAHPLAKALRVYITG